MSGATAKAAARTFGGHTSVGRIKSVIMKHPAQAFISQEHLSKMWRHCRFQQEPDFQAACAEFDHVLNVLRSRDIDPILLPQDDNTTADSIHTHDSAFIHDGGYLPMRFAKGTRACEVGPMAECLDGLGVPRCAPSWSRHAHVEAGDFIWLNERMLCVGNGYRTNTDGVEEMRSLLGDKEGTLFGRTDADGDGRLGIAQAVDVFAVPLPHFEGANVCLHLLSACSPLSDDTWLVYKRVMPVVFLRFLEDNHIRVIEAADDEWHSWGSNVLATAPGELIATEGNPKTLQRMTAMGMDVTVVKADNICAVTGGGPTCITRPVLREVV